MRIAIVTTSYPLWQGQAAGHFVAAEARHLCRVGHAVTVIAPGPRTSREGSEPTVLRIGGGALFGPPGVTARLRENPLRALGGIRFGLGVRRALSELGPFDQLIGHWFLPSAWPLGVGHAKHVEGVAHGSDVRLLASLPKSLRQAIGGELSRHRVTLRCVSEATREALIAATSPELRAQTRVEAASLQLDPQLTRRRGPDRSSEPALLVIVARLVPEKRVRVALEAVTALPRVRVVVVGGGPLYAALCHDFPDVHFTGELPRPEALEWIARADALLSASLHEGAPLAVREARALGVPVIASPAGDLERWALDDAGLWIAPRTRAAPAPR